MPGMAERVIPLVDQRLTALRATVPAQAVVVRDGHNPVFVIDASSQKASQRKLVVGRRVGERVAKTPRVLLPPKRGGLTLAFHSSRLFAWNTN